MAEPRAVLVRGFSNLHVINRDSLCLALGVKKLRKILVPIIIGVLAISLAMTGLVYAAGDDPSTPNRTGMTYHRNISIEESPDAVIIRSSVVNGSVENHIGLLFNTAHGIVIHIAFSHDSEVTNVENEAFLYLRVAYVSLTEFNDTNGNGGLDSTDKVVQVVNLQNLTYSMPSWKPILSQDGKRGVQIMSNTTAPSGLFFGVVADIFPQYALVNNTILPPTATKITTTINNFLFKNPADKLALQVRAVSATQIEHETPTNEESIRVRSATAQGFYTWTPAATVDGTSRSVTSSFTKSPKGWLINQSYPSGKSIVHDPVLGFDLSAPTPIINASFLIGAAIVSLAVVGVMVYAGRRYLVSVFSPKPTSM